MKEVLVKTAVYSFLFSLQLLCKYWILFAAESQTNFCQRSSGDRATSSVQKGEIKNYRIQPGCSNVVVRIPLIKQEVLRSIRHIPYTVIVKPKA